MDSLSKRTIVFANLEFDFLMRCLFRLDGLYVFLYSSMQSKNTIKNDLTD